MTVSATTGGPGLRSLKAIGVLTVVTLAGPLAGSLLVFCCVYPVLRLFGVDLVEGANSGDTPADSMLVNALIFFVVMGYFLGGLQALLTGLWAAWSAWRSGTFSRRGAIMAAIAASVLWIALSRLSPLAEGAAGVAESAATAATVAIALTPIAIVGALFTRWLCVKLGLIQDTAAA